jgi:hypothetical protein
MANSNLSKLNSSSYPESLVVQTLQAASSLSNQVKLAAHKIAVDVKDIKPRETQALMDEIEARILEGSLL